MRTASARHNHDLLDLRVEQAKLLRDNARSSSLSVLVLIANSTALLLFSGHGAATLYWAAIAFALERRLFDEGKVAHVLAGHNARLGISSDLDFSAAARAENLRRAAEVSRLFNQAGRISICSFLSPSAEDRQTARDIVTGGDHGSPFLEVYCNAPDDVAAQRAQPNMPGTTSEYPNWRTRSAVAVRARSRLTA